MEEKETTMEGEDSFLFQHLVAMFQALALQQLGKIMNPVTGKVERDLQQAKITIDMIDMIQKKTAGNLTAGEKKLIDGILMDLGVSSPQLDDAERGFSFLRSGPLDMRMDTTRGESARQWLARVKPADLINVLKKYGEEKFARRIANAIVEARAQRDIVETGDLAHIIANAIPVKEKNKHPATRSFQAIRIYINDELRVIEQGLQGAVSVLAKGGRLVVISFHSLEDRIVKRFMRDISSRPKLPPGLPVMDADIAVPFRLVAKPVTAGADELAQNPRSRSARLRVLEKCL